MFEVIRWKFVDKELPKKNDIYIVTKLDGTVSLAWFNTETGWSDFLSINDTLIAWTEFQTGVKGGDKLVMNYDLLTIEEIEKLASKGFRFIVEDGKIKKVVKEKKGNE